MWDRFNTLEIFIVCNMKSFIIQFTGCIFTFKQRKSLRSFENVKEEFYISLTHLKLSTFFLLEIFFLTSYSASRFKKF